jgi:hypothetical protein
MTRRPTDAQRIDRAVSAVLEDRPVALPPPLADELSTARALRADLPLVPPGDAFEEALALRLSDGHTSDAGSWVGDFARRHHRLVLTGAVGSVLVSTAGAAVFAWRLVHRP